MNIEQAFPKGFKPQHTGIAAADALADLPPPVIVEYLRRNPDTARRLLSKSYDKRCTPSSFIVEKGELFEVGWFSLQLRQECVQEFSTLADAATDYLLLSLGLGRWTPPKHTGT